MFDQLAHDGDKDEGLSASDETPLLLHGNAGGREEQEEEETSFEEDSLPVRILYFYEFCSILYL